MNISLCVIVKNGAEGLSSLLRSAKEHVKEMIVVDTGSTDDSKEIARDAGAKVFDFTWVDDFSKARNESLKHATGDYILVLDADETFDSWDEIDKAVASGHQGYQMIQRNYTDSSKAGWQHGAVDNPVVRLFKNDNNIRYSYRVHEVVEPSIIALQGKIETTSIVIHHKGFQHDLEHKRQYYLQLGLKDIQDLPDDPKPRYEVGLIYLNTKQYEKAIEQLEKCHTIKPLYKRVGVVLSQAKAAVGNMEEAVRLLADYLQVRQHDASAFNTMALFCTSLGNHDMAMKAFNSCLQIMPEHPAALLNKGILHVKQKEYEEAKECFEKAVEQNPEHEKARINLSAVNVELGNKKVAMDILKPLLGKSTNPRVYSNMAQLYMQHNKSTEAKEMFRKAIELGSPYRKQFEETIKKL